MELNLSIKDENVPRIIASIDGNEVEARKGNSFYIVSNKIDKTGKTDDQIISAYIKLALSALVNLHEYNEDSENYRETINSISIPEPKDLEVL